MNIGVDARYLGMANSGLARYSESLLQALSREDEDNDYVVFVNARLRRKLKLGSNFKIIPIKGNPASLNSLRRLALAARREELDLLHVHYPLAPPLLDCPLLLTVHDVFPFTSNPEAAPFWHQPARWLWTYLFYPMSLKRARWIICVSLATRDAVCRLFPELFHKTIVLRSGVSESFRGPIEGPTLELIRQRLELPRPYLFYSGSARSDKNLVAMLTAFAMLRARGEQFQDYSMVLEIPMGDYGLPQVYKAIHQLNLVDHVRICHDLGEDERRVVFEEASLFCIFSRTEGFGVPVLEAQLCNVPVLAVDSGALPEIAGENGAVYIDPANLDETVSWMERVLTDDSLRAYLIENGRENAMKYEWGETAARLQQVYELLYFPREQVRLPGEGGLLPRLMEWLKI